MALSSETVGVHDLAYLARVLPLVAPEERRQLSKAQKAIAELVASQARSNAGEQGAMAASAAESITTSGRALGAEISLGDAAHPWTFGTEFGAKHDVPRKRKSGTYLGYDQFPQPNSKGYWFFPAIEQSQPQVAAQASAAVEAAWRTVVGTS